MRTEAYLEMADTEARHWWFVGRRMILASVLESLSLKPDARILEVGAGTGGNLEMLARFGRVDAMEMSDEARILARQKTFGRFDIKRGACPHEVPDFCTSFDLICMFDVLEHIDEDVQTLVALRRLLKPRGQIFITVPAYEWLWSAHDEHLHHKRRYTARKLRGRVEAAGLRVQRMTYFNTLLLPAVAAARVRDRLTGAQAATGTAVPKPLTNAILTKLFASERFLLRWLALPAGVSLLAVVSSDGANAS
jgi:SAM-dependent methyltransferase